MRLKRPLSTFYRRARVYGAIGAVGLGLLACVTAPLETPKTKSVGTSTIYVAQNLKNKVDILFMVDNSNSMDAMQMELRNKFPDFFTPFQAAAQMGTYADLHIGVVTSDYGAGATGAPGCTPSPGGQQGRLQALGVKAAQTCQPPGADDTTGNGTKTPVKYIHYSFDPALAKLSNLPANQNLNDTFTCMASVGATGCGFEHQLESVYAALHNNLPDNVGFLRDDALLTVVFLTNEDDASAPPDTDIFDKNKVAQYGYEDSYSRQTRFAIVCCPPGQASCDPSALVQPPYGDSMGDLAQCQGAPNDPPGSTMYKQYDINRYVDFFSKPAAQGGVKTDPLDITLVGIDGPETPVQVILSNPGTVAGQAYQPCSPLNETSNPPCVPVLQHSCVNQVESQFFGDPSVRLNAVIRSARTNAITSICGDDPTQAPTYTKALQTVADQIISKLSGGCIPNKLPYAGSGTSCDTDTDCQSTEKCSGAVSGQTKSGTCATLCQTSADCGVNACSGGGVCIKTDCTVSDVTANADGTTTVTSIPQCTTPGPNPPGSDPCWRIGVKLNNMNMNACGANLSPDGVGLTVDRGGAAAPDHTTAQVSCAFGS